MISQNQMHVEDSQIKDFIIDAINSTSLLGNYDGSNIYHNKLNSASSIIIQTLKKNELHF
jgi:hypothetical protein